MSFRMRPVAVQVLAGDRGRSRRNGRKGAEHCGLADGYFRKGGSDVIRKLLHVRNVGHGQQGLVDVIEFVVQCMTGCAGSVGEGSTAPAQRG